VKILNLYAGIGGNRKRWSGNKHDITAVEMNEEIAEEYKIHFPEDEVIVGDAHEYLKNNYQEYDFVWSSPPCQTHSQLHLCNVGRDRTTAEYPDMKLWQEIIFLRSFFDGDWVVENVRPHYKELIKPQKCGRHYVWSNFAVPDVKVSRNFEYSKSGQGDIEKIEEWLGIELKNRQIYVRDNHDPSQVLRNCVHPKIGEAILDNCNTRQSTLEVIEQ
jgi:DNA (cytosine-5)-methyltransferase 1